MTAYVGIPIFLVIYGAHRIYAWSDPWAYPAESVDMHTGMAEVLAEETPPKVIVGPWWKKLSLIWQ